MRRLHLALALLPTLGLLELALHQLFARRAPGFEDYAALAPELIQQKRPGVPVVVAPAWAEPLVRQAAPAAFPLVELARPDDSAFSELLEVSLLGQRAPELAEHPIASERRVGAFVLRTLENPRVEPVVYDFVTAVESGAVEVFSKQGETLLPCRPGRVGRASTGGLHGHVAYPQQRHECPGGRLVGVTLIEDADYRPRRCILVQPPVSGSLLLRFGAVPKSRKLVGFRGLSYFLERDDIAPAAELSLHEAGRMLGQQPVVGAAGWSRFEQARVEASDSLDVEVKALRAGVDVCFALEAR